MTAIQKSFSFFDSCLFQGRLMLSHQALGEWTKRQSSQSVYLQIDDSSETHRLVREHPGRGRV